ncbi:MAG: response regulator transcription factor [Chloroflexi bacterium]|nr:response regulator transcription factor [Chloroflexota bacterium]
MVMISEVQPVLAQDAIDQLVSHIDSDLGRLTGASWSRDRSTVHLVMALEFMRLWSQSRGPAVPGGGLALVDDGTFPQAELSAAASEAGPAPASGSHGSAEDPWRGEMRTGQIRVVPDMWEAYAGSVPLRLSPTEFKMLARLVSKQGGVVPHDMLAREVWGVPTADARHRTLLKLHMRRLRCKLMRAGAEPGLVVSVWGLGYRLRAMG